MPSSDTYFKPGNNANPKGRPPKEWTMSTLIEEALEEVEEQSGKTYKKLVAKKLASMAIKGDIQAIKEINDRIDGRPKQPIDSKVDSTVRIIVEDYGSKDQPSTQTTPGNPAE